MSTPIPLLSVTPLSGIPNVTWNSDPGAVVSIDPIPQLGHHVLSQQYPNSPGITSQGLSSQVPSHCQNSGLGTSHGQPSMPQFQVTGSPAAQTSVPTSARPSKAEADKEPWRYRGYPATCTFMASDDDFFVLRRFGKLGARVALLMQDRVAYLEEQLQEEDLLCSQAQKDEADSGTFRCDARPRRQEVLEEISWRLERYQRFILDHSQLKSRRDATSFQIRNIREWFKNNNNPIREEEAEFIEKAGDLIPVVPKEKTPLRRFIDKFDCIRSISCFQLEQRELNESHYDSETTIYNKDDRIDKFVTCTTIIIGLAMLIGPLWLLQHVSFGPPNLRARLVIITAFLIAFTILLSIVTVAKPFEVLAATAAYGAVLMVFMQLGGGVN